MKIQKILIMSITIILVGLILFLFLASLHEIDKHDISTKSPAICDIKCQKPIYLVTYGDGDVYIANSKVLVESALRNCVDVAYIYNRQHLDEAFVLKNKRILDQKRGAGYWLWKPYIVLKTLNQIPEGAVMIYMDSGIKIIRPLDSLVNNIMGYDMVFADNEPHNNAVWTKRDLFRIMGIDYEQNKDSKQLTANIFIIKNTSYSREFIKNWLRIGEMPGAIDDSPSVGNDPSFIEHRHDQSIFSLLYLQNPHNIKLMSFKEIGGVFVDVHRRRDIDNSSLYFENDKIKPDPKSFISLFVRAVEKNKNKLLKSLLKKYRICKDFILN